MSRGLKIVQPSCSGALGSVTPCEQGAEYCSLLVSRGRSMFTPGFQGAGEFSSLLSSGLEIVHSCVQGLEIVHPSSPGAWRLLNSGVKGAGDQSPSFQGPGD